MSTPKSLAFVVLLLLLLGAVAHADVCPPDFSTDSVSVNPSCPGLGTRVIAIPDSVWVVDWNDNPGNAAPGVGCTPTSGGCDFDFNDASETIWFDGNGSFATILVGAGLSGWTDTFLANGIPFANNQQPGAAATVQSFSYGIFNVALEDPARDIFYAGPSSVNFDGAVHDWTERLDIPVDPTPEPSSIGLLGLAIAGTAWLVKKRLAR